MAQKSQTHKRRGYSAFRADLEHLFHSVRGPPDPFTRVWIEASAALPFVGTSAAWSATRTSPGAPGPRRAPFAGNPNAASIEGHGESIEQALLFLARNARAAGGGPMPG
jgi:hypothetical protein